MFGITKEHKRKYNARLNAILDELEDYYHYEEYKKRFNLLFEFYQLDELLKYYYKDSFILCIDSAPIPVPCVLP